MDKKVQYVYHGSTHQGLKIINRNKSTHGQSWVYGTLSKAISAIFISNKGSDLYYHLSGNGSKDNPVILVERKKDMFKEKDVLDFTDKDDENYKQFLEDIAPRPIAEGSNVICLSGVINGMPPLVKNIDSKELKTENFAPIKGIPYNKGVQLEVKGYRSGTRSSIIKAKKYEKKEYL